jgi:hypothetical protein
MISHYPGEWDNRKRRREENRKAEGEQPRPQRAKKDRHRWCKGRAGVEHEIVIRPWRQYPQGKWLREVCTVCGREFHLVRLDEAH